MSGDRYSSNGKTPGITLPDAALQAQVIRRAHQKACLDPADTDNIECHGTGTPVGDPIEVDALSRCFRPRAGSPLLIGSVYLMAGCLGGLGSSLSRWMMARDARHFIFLGRSGCDKPSAQVTWNLHHALEAGGLDKHLDLVLLTSSISGTVGTATASNYCAASGFLDAFARWRRCQGNLKPTDTAGLGMISEVGYLHENPDIEALLLRKGIRHLSEDEFLPHHPHIFTGLEAFSMRKLLAQGFGVSNGTMQDPRGAVLAASLQAEQDAKSVGNGRDRAQLDSLICLSAKTQESWSESRT
ncbi:thiolase-like protein [Diplogelasinospora grovesii]|uniref:Thiolase-like protein n=1 Tax=Diplogelasinospora grovesii TaxID=303347 RepID=A0AAN6MXU0_9PEZI|nr:thiolase-like protein [Diplogelasinospora grovesii]